MAPHQRSRHDRIRDRIEAIRADIGRAEKAPELAGFDDADEITAVEEATAEMRAVIQEIRARQPSQSEIHVHVAPSKPDSEPPKSEAQPNAMSFAAGGTRVRASGWGLLALLVVGLIVLWAIAGGLIRVH